MSDQPWIDSGPPEPPPPPPPPPGIGDLPAPNAPPRVSGGHAPGQVPVAPPSAAPSPLAAIERLANISLGLSIASLLCGAFFLIVPIAAFVLAVVAERKARVLGKTSSDGRIRTAKIVSIVALALWIVIFIAVIINDASQPS